ncbi:MAG: alpha/beta fold hydrolase [Thermoanaerobaculia bacterium]|nr:alpha/beta fold hydrolase [Thermoanaerobaculia bacterium]
MIEHTTAEIDGLRLHLAEAGPAEGPLVVLLHGFPELWYGWRHQIQPLAEAGFRVLAPDQRGYNESDKPRRVRDYRLDRLADDVAALIETRGRASARLVGHDWGGAVAWWTAVRHRDRVERLAVLNCPHPLAMRRELVRNRAQLRKSWYMLFFQLPWLPEWWYRRRDFDVGVRSVRGTARRGAFDDEEMERYKEAWRKPRALRSMIHWYRASLRHPPARVRDPAVSAPTLLLWGLKDRFLGPELIDSSLRYAPDARVERLPEATHWLQHEEPERVNEKLIGFLAEQRA